MTPTVWSLLVTGTLTLTPALIAWFWDQVSVPGVKRAGVIWTIELAANELVLITPGLLMMKPDGWTVAIAVSSS